MESTNQGIPFEGNPSPFSSWGNIAALYIATLSLPGITIGLPVWLFSTSIIQNTMIPEQSNQHPVDTEVDPSPSSSFVSPSPSSSSLGENSDVSNQVTKKKKKGKEKKKKLVKQGGNHAASGENPDTKIFKPKDPCIICRGDHLHRECPCNPWILREWSPHSHQPVSSTSGDHVDNTPSTSNNGQKERSKFHVSYVKGNIHFPVFLFWVKPKKSCITVLLHPSNFHLDIGSSSQVLY